MYCTQCRFELEDEDRFCAKCGKPVQASYATAQRAPTRLSRPMDQKKIAGVCAGFARYFDVDVTLMRILWIAAAILSGGLLVLVYIFAWILMPKDYRSPLPEPQHVSQPV